MSQENPEGRVPPDGLGLTWQSLATAAALLIAMLLMGLTLPRDIPVKREEEEEEESPALPFQAASGRWVSNSNFGEERRRRKSSGGRRRGSRGELLGGSGGSGNRPKHNLTVDLEEESDDCDLSTAAPEEELGEAMQRMEDMQRPRAASINAPRSAPWTECEFSDDSYDDKSVYDDGETHDLRVWEEDDRVAPLVTPHRPRSLENTLQSSLLSGTWNGINVEVEGLEDGGETVLIYIVRTSDRAILAETVTDDFEHSEDCRNIIMKLISALLAAERCELCSIRTELHHTQCLIKENAILVATVPLSYPTNLSLALLSTLWCRFRDHAVLITGKNDPSEAVACYDADEGEASFNMALQDVWEEFADPSAPKNLARGMSGIGSPVRKSACRKLTMLDRDDHGAVAAAQEFDVVLPVLAKTSQKLSY